MLISTTNELAGYRVTGVLGECSGEDAAAPSNAVLAMHVDTSDTGGNWTEICAYGTAIVIEAAA